MFQSISRRLQDSLAEANQVATETFSHIKTVKSFANEDGETERYRGRLDNIYSINKREAVAYALNMWSSTVSVQRFLWTVDSNNHFTWNKGDITYLSHSRLS